MNDLKEKALRGGIAKIINQAVNFTLRIGSMAVLARLLNPKDFGLVAMVTVVTGVYDIFTSAGLSSATIQRSSVTDEQVSTLFWINILIGLLLALLCVVSAPFIVMFYNEPRLFWVTVALAAGFLLNAAGVQHSALLQRQMRFLALTVIDMVSLAASIAVGIAMAFAGYGYWALVGMSIVSPAVSTALKWMNAGWIPGMPRRGSGIRSMLRFGGTITLNNLIVYLAYNLEKVFLGRFMGAAVLGFYTRAYYLISIPTQNLNATIGAVGFSALSRLQDDPERLKNYFLKGYSLIMSMTLPITMFCALFADDLILVVLGPKWKDVIAIFRLLTPTVLIFGMLNPWGWLLQSIGLQQRSLKIALVIAPTIITAYLIGLPYGARGVAGAYSAAMTLMIVPLIAWCIRGTNFTGMDVFRAIRLPFLSGFVSALLCFALRTCFDQWLPPMLMLVAGGIVMACAHLGMLMFVMGQKEMYLNLWRDMRGRSSAVEVADAKA